MQSHSNGLLGKLLFLAFALVFFSESWSQTKPIEGIRENTPQVHALVNARIVQAPGVVIEKGTIVLRDGTVEAVGAEITPPPDARIWDYEGMTVYAGLIESYSQLGLPKEAPRAATQRGTGGPQPQQQTAPRKGAEHWNPKVLSEVNALDQFQPNAEDLKELRALGFTAAVVAPTKGIFNGTSAVVSLKEGSTNDQLLKDNVAQNIMFNPVRRPRFGRPYPSSQMGIIALIRQTFLDADWYQKAHNAYSLGTNGQARPEANESLAALGMASAGKQPVLLRVQDDLNFLRAVRVVREFNLNAWVLGSGHEYRQIAKIKAAAVPVILPVNFPENPKVDSPEEALDVSLQELSHWDVAPENPKRLSEAGIPFAFTTSSLKNSSDFPKRLRTAIDRGLSEDAALAALTTTPAKMVGLQNRLGSIDAGKLAHLVVTDGNLFKEKTKIYDVWVDGSRYVANEKPDVDPRGKWTSTFTGVNPEPLILDFEINGEIAKLSGSISTEEKELTFKKVSLDHKRLTVTVRTDSIGMPGVVRMSASVNHDRIAGQGQLPDGRWFKWVATKNAAEAEEPESKEMAKETSKRSEAPAYPLGAYTAAQAPEQPETILVRGATIWTSGPQGNLENADLLVKKGKISAIGKDLRAPSDAVVIDAKGKHVTAGLIDAHSHSGLSSINEGSQAVTSEVRTRDVINSYDIGLYRELAGGLTTANQLHGSANPIGGQNSVIKLHWGSLPEEMIIADAPQGIKFALGENVKRSRSSSNNRYPDTRMGVEQIIRDRFKAAQDYERAWQTYNSANKKKKQGMIPPRRDLELEALVEILNGKRLVHSHSYRQDEILMLVRVADDFGFTIGTFQHVLEGYKVAEALAQHGAGASTFSDWWAYKFEVYDAIPYNGALMHDAGVVVSFNSDSGELARRMNLEAAKAVKYGGVSPEEALKFVTLNPAKQLRIDHRVGSLEPGKDADFVIWNGSPLSTYSMCEQTWLDGRKYFDRETDKKMQEVVMAERARLIQKVLASADTGSEKGSKRGRMARPTN